MPSRPHTQDRGPFRVDQLQSGDPYELSNGHALYALPTGGRGSRGMIAAATALGTDPAVEEVGADTGYAITGNTLRAPDIAVGRVPDAPGWVKGVPPLAVEYADTGQDERELQEKIGDLLAHGTRWIWVVRMVGPRLVEVYAPGVPPVVKTAGEILEAPGILANPVPVAALFDAEAAREVALRNLLQRHGYQGIDAVRAEGREEGREEGALAEVRAAVVAVVAARGIALDAGAKARIEGENSRETLARWLVRAATATTAGEVFRA